VRTLEKGAHLRRNRRGFPRCALSKPCAPSKQVRTFGRALALHPVPLTYGCAQPLAPASFAVFAEGSSSFMLSVRREGDPGVRDLRAKRISLFAAGAGPPKPFRSRAGSAIGADSEEQGPAIERAAPLDQARLRMSEIYSVSLYRVWLYRCSLAELCAKQSSRSRSISLKNARGVQSLVGGEDRQQGGEVSEPLFAALRPPINGCTRPDLSRRQFPAQEMAV
jgi:hypothetical protein